MRRRIQPWLTLFLVFFMALALWPSARAESTNAMTKALQDPAAVATIQAALTAMGGASNIALIQNSVVQGTSAPTPDDGSGTANFTWTCAGSEFRHEINAATGSHVLVSSGGSPQDFHDAVWVAVPPVTVRTNLPYHIPALVLFNEISNPSYSLIFLGPTKLNGKTAIHVQTRDYSDATGQLFTLQDWYFDPVMGLPLRVGFQMPVSQNPNDSLNASMDFSSFAAVNAVLVPFQLNITEGPVSLVSTVTSVVFNTPIDPSAFTPSAGGAQ